MSQDGQGGHSATIILCDRCMSKGKESLRLACSLVLEGLGLTRGLSDVLTLLQFEGVAAHGHDSGAAARLGEGRERGHARR